ncbi:MAG: electron transport complex subunit G, partial [Colwellia sp.]
MSDKIDSTQDKSEPESNNDIDGENSNTGSENKALKSPLSTAISKNTKILALFAIACTFAVGLVSELTKDRIK